MVSQFLNLACVVLIFAMFAGGLGLGGPPREEDHGLLMARLLIATQILCAWDLCLTKLSLLLMYYRTLDLRTRSRMHLFVLAGLVLAWVTTATIVSVFVCGRHKHWYPRPAGTCLNHMPVWIAGAALTILTDLAVLFFPMPHLWGLNLNLREKAAMVLVFAMGFL